MDYWLVVWIQPKSISHIFLIMPNRLENQKYFEPPISCSTFYLHTANIPRDHASKLPLRREALRWVVTWSYKWFQARKKLKYLGVFSDLSLKHVGCLAQDKKKKPPPNLWAPNSTNCSSAEAWPDCQRSWQFYGFYGFYMVLWWNVKSFCMDPKLKSSPRSPGSTPSSAHEGD